jgi:hypothetical protein
MHPAPHRVLKLAHRIDTPAARRLAEKAIHAAHHQVPAKRQGKSYARKMREMALEAGVWDEEDTTEEDAHA